MSRSPNFNELLVGLFRSTTTMARGVAEAHGVTLQQAIALDVIKRGEAQPMAVLAAELDLTMGAVSKMVDRLVLAGHVERKPHPTDRRVAALALTGAGEAIAAGIQAEWERLMGEWLARVPEAHAIERALAALLATAPA